MPTNIVFDFGAVLFNWKPADILRARFPVHAATAEAAQQLSSDIFHHADWQNFDRGSLAQDVVVRQTADRLGLPHGMVRDLVAGIPAYLLPIQDTVDLLGRLHRRRHSHGDVRLYFLSNMPEPYARILQQRHDFLAWFEGGLFSGDVLLVKPEPDIFRMLETRYALDPAKTLFIDDLDANVQAARAHGWSAVQFESAALLAPHLQALMGD